MSNVWIIADTAYVQSVHNKSLSWVNSTVLHNLTVLSGYDFKFMFDSKDKSRLACGQYHTVVLSVVVVVVVVFMQYFGLQSVHIVVFKCCCCCCFHAMFWPAVSTILLSSSVVVVVVFMQCYGL